jgi:hypothetical protein
MFLVTHLDLPFMFHPLLCQLGSGSLHPARLRESNLALCHCITKFRLSEYPNLCIAIIRAKDPEMINAMNQV